jgi:SAM-dependent methyltransferase
MSSGNLLNGYDVVACRECGFCFADGIPGQADFDAYYHDMSKYDHQDRQGVPSSADQARFKAMASIIIPFLDRRRDMRIREIGCATGHLLHLLRRQGWEHIDGIDPSPACAEAAQRLYGIPVAVNTLSNMPAVSESVDFLVLIGVLEHVRDLGSALTRLRKILSPGGKMFVTVPDASRYAEGRDAPFQEFSLEHINFLGPQSLRNLMRAHGFSSVKSRQSLVHTSSRTTTPVMHAVFRKDKGIVGRPSFRRDTLTQVGLTAYIETSRREDERIGAVISGVAKGGRPIIVWGTGAHTLRLLANGVLDAVKIAAFVDSSPHYQGKRLSGTTIVSPATIRNRTNPILISSRVFQKEIQRQIRHDLGWKNELILLY